MRFDSLSACHQTGRREVPQKAKSEFERARFFLLQIFLLPLVATDFSDYTDGAR